MSGDTPVPSSSTSDRGIGEEGRAGNLGTVAGRADAGKRILHTIDPNMLIAWGNVLAFGAQKYHQRNFLKAPGMAWGRVYDSLQGHLQKFWGGEWLDDESGYPHLAHVLCNLQFLWTYHEHEAYKPGDDRPSSIEYLGLKYEDWEARFKEAALGPNTDPGRRDNPLNVPDILGALGRSSGHSERSRPSGFKPAGKEFVPEHYNATARQAVMPTTSSISRVKDIVLFAIEKKSPAVVLAWYDAVNVARAARARQDYHSIVVDHNLAKIDAFEQSNVKDMAFETAELHALIGAATGESI